MSRPSSIRTLLPAETIEELNQRLLDPARTETATLDWLHASGHSRITKSALNRYKNSLRAGKVELCRMLVGDDTLPEAAAAALADGDAATADLLRELVGHHLRAGDTLKRLQLHLRRYQREKAAREHVQPIVDSLLGGDRE